MTSRYHTRACNSVHQRETLQCRLELRRLVVGTPSDERGGMKGRFG